MRSRAACRILALSLCTSEEGNELALSLASTVQEGRKEDLLIPGSQQG